MTDSQTQQQSDSLNSETVHQTPARLDALTSLRFFAAMMIFTLHCSQMTGIAQTTFIHKLALSQGVSFFFILSGFILAHVYPKFSSDAEVRQFYLARFARIWPTHVATFFMTLLMVPVSLNISHPIIKSILNLALVQSWLFNSRLATSFNDVSWSISVEFFFYLCFPFLQKRRAAVATIAGAMVCLVAICLLFQSGIIFRTSEFIDENPLVRIGEFALGIFSYSIYQKLSSRPLTRSTATIFELLAIALIALPLNIPSMWGPSIGSGAPWALMNASIHMGGAPFYAALIILFALCKGTIARALCLRPFVWLGEISFVIYMVHGCILGRAALYRQSFENLPAFVFPSLCFALTLVVASLTHEFVETPFRRVILHHKEHNSARTLLEFIKPSSHSKKNRPAIALLLMQAALLVLLAQWLVCQTRQVSFLRCKQIVDNSLPTTRNLQFEDRLRLLGIKISQKKDGIWLTHAWQLSKNQQLCSGTRIELLNAEGKPVWQNLDSHDLLNRSAHSGTMWEETIKVPQKAVLAAITVRESVYDPILGRNLKIANQGNEQYFSFPNLFKK